MELPISRGHFDSVLRRHVVEVWYPRCIDHEYGGFLCDFDRRWRTCGPHDKMLEFQARHTWFAAAAWQVYPDYPYLKEAAIHGLKYLNEAMWDSEHGGWYQYLDRSGKPQANKTKHSHATSYAIAASAVAAAALQDPVALEHARAGFEWLDAHAHDKKHGAYFGLMRRDGVVIREPGGEDWRNELDQIGTPVGLKDANVHNDLLEALLCLYAVWPNECVEDRLAEIVDFMRKHMIEDNGALLYHISPDGAPVSSYVQYGHNFQAAYRTLRTLCLIGERDQGIREARRLLDYALTQALDISRGGYRHSNMTAPGTPAAGSKQWWIQAEGIHALVEVSRACPEEEKYMRALTNLWTYCQKFLFDQQYGGLYMEPLDMLPPRPELRKARHTLKESTRKGSVWKYVGHEGEALLAGLRHASELPRSPVTQTADRTSFPTEHDVGNG